MTEQQAYENDMNSKDEDIICYVEPEEVMPKPVVFTSFRDYHDLSSPNKDSEYWFGI